MRRLDWVVLAGVLLLALVWRLQGVFWDQYSAGHPDERFVASISAAMSDPDARLQAVQDRCATTAFFHTACSPFNPNNLSESRFAYGTFPLLVVNQIAGGVSAATGDANWQSPQQIVLIGRVVNAVADTLTVLLIFWVARQVTARRYALLAAALYAGAVLPIQLAHFWTVDTIANTAFWLLVATSLKIQRTNAPVFYGLAGVAAGLASASRANLVIALVLIPIAAAIYLTQHEHAPQRVILRRIGCGLGLAAVAFFCTFRAAQPYAFAAENAFDVVETLDTETPFIHLNWNAQWRTELEEVAALSTNPAEDWPPSYQWYGRPAYLTPWWQWVWGMGAVLWAMGTVAVIAALMGQVRRVMLSPEVGVLSLWFLLYFAWQGQLHVMTMRYYLPLYGVLIVLAVWWLQRFPRRGGWQLLRRWGPPITLVGTLLWALFFTAIYRQPHTRITAAFWLRDNIPAMVYAGHDRGVMPLDVLISAQNTIQSPLVAIPVVANRTTTVDFLPFEVAKNVEVAAVNAYLPQVSSIVRVRARLYRLSLSGEMIYWEGALVPHDIPGDYQHTDALPTLDSGTYRWQFSVEGIETGAATNYVYMLPIVSHITSGGASVPQSLTLDPAAPVLLTLPYTYVGPQNPLMLRVEAPVQLQRLGFAHQLGNTPALELIGDDRDITLTSLSAANTATVAGATQILGQRGMYQVPEGVQLAAGIYRLFATEGVWLTPTTIATEGRWDASTPSRVCWQAGDDNLGFVPFADCTFNSGFDRNWYTELPLPMVAPDTPQKAQQLQAMLGAADYLTISSNRMYDALPRFPARYPDMAAYYSDLFAERPGFRIVRRFSSFPRLGPFILRDQVLPDDGPAWLNPLASEEAFSVYDHPTIYVFQNIAPAD
jgi:hypothetical protein